MSNFTAEAIGDLTGRRAVITGANSGLGLQTAIGLARKGADVVLACRDAGRGREAERRVRAETGSSSVEMRQLDLSDLGSVRRFAADLTGPVHLLINNAGVMATPRGTTADGFELQFGTNHLGHYALTALLLPALSAAGTRIVHLGSISHRWARLTPSSLQPARYVNARAYATSKLAVMAYGFELARRLRLTGSTATSVVAHPGFALGMLTPERSGVAAHEDAAPWRRRVMAQVAQGKDEGARPLVRAVADPTVPNGAYCGPDGWFQLTGEPAIVDAEPRAREANAASRLIDLSADLTGVELRFR